MLIFIWKRILRLDQRLIPFHRISENEKQTNRTYIKFK